MESLPPEVHGFFIDLQLLENTTNLLKVTKTENLFCVVQQVLLLNTTIKLMYLFKGIVQLDFRSPAFSSAEQDHSVKMFRFWLRFILILVLKKRTPCNIILALLRVNNF